MKTLVVNLIGAPGTGKSTTMAGVFAKLKSMGLLCEMVTEFAKELVWEERNETFKDELYIFAKQAHRLFRVNGKVRVVVTDRPLILTVLYNNKYGNKSKNLDNLVIEEFNKYDNLNYLLNRVSDYEVEGRNETEEQSNELGEELENILKENNIYYNKLDTDDLIVDRIVMDIVQEIYFVSKDM